MDDLTLNEQGWSGTMRTTTLSSDPGRLEPFGQQWWLRRLNRRLDERQSRMRRLVDYYDGRHVMKLVSDQFREEFAKRFPEYADNFMPLVVNTEAQRLHVQGIRYGTERAGDPDAWQWWQDNHLDADAGLAHAQALLKGICHVMVWADPGGEPRVTIEDAMQTVVDTIPGRRWDRRAAFKRWVDDDGHMVGELYMPTDVTRWRTRDKWTSTAPMWEPTEWDGTHALDNPTGVVPILPMVNRPSLSRIVAGTLTPDDDGESELEAAIGNQDHINAYRMMIVVASEFASFRQRWALNLDLPKDPRTNQPMQPWRAGVQHIIAIPPPDPEEFPDARTAPQVSLGEFEQTDTSGLLNAIQAELRRMATKVQMPYHFLLESQTVPPSGESIKSAEASFVMKCEDAQVSFGETWEEAFRLNFLWRGDARGRVTGAEVFWRDAASRAEGVLTDAMIKARSFGVADQMLQERWGMSPLEIERNKALIAAQSADDDAVSDDPEQRDAYMQKGSV